MSKIKYLLYWWVDIYKKNKEVRNKLKFQIQFVLAKKNRTKEEKRVKKQGLKLHKIVIKKLVIQEVRIEEVVYCIILNYYLN